jgi:UDPglucose 6-dehydrogenase
MNKNLKIGFIGQGWIGRNYADDFEERGFDIVRYGLEKEFVVNKDVIAECDFVFIAVPTPTTKKGFDYSNVEDALKLIGKGKTAIIKSTLVPGTTNTLALKFPKINVTHSPEFLREATAAYDARNPDRNIVGVPTLNVKYRTLAGDILQILPKAKFERVMQAREAEMVKYAGNCYLYTKVVFFNMLYDLSKKSKLDFDNIVDAVVLDPRIGPSHAKVSHNSGHSKKAGRGAGGHCFIKDYEAFLNMYEEAIGNDAGYKALKAYREKNNELLVQSKKDLDLLEGVIGKLDKYKK